MAVIQQDKGRRGKGKCCKSDWNKQVDVSVAKLSEKMQLLQCRKSESTNLIGSCFLQWECKEIVSQGKIVFKVNFNAVVPVSFSYIHMEPCFLLLRRNRSFCVPLDETQPPEVWNNSSQPTWRLLLASSHLMQFSYCFISAAVVSRGGQNVQVSVHPSAAAGGKTNIAVTDYIQTSFEAVSVLRSSPGGADLHLLHLPPGCRFLRNATSSLQISAGVFL